METFTELISNNNTFIDLDNNYYKEIFSKASIDQSPWKYRIIIKPIDKNETSVIAYKLKNDRLIPDHHYKKVYKNNENIRIKQIFDDVIEFFDWGASIEPKQNEEESKLDITNNDLSYSYNEPLTYDPSLSVIADNNVTRNRGTLENLKSPKNESMINSSLSNIEFRSIAIEEGEVSLTDFF